MGTKAVVASIVTVAASVTAASAGSFYTGNKIYESCTPNKMTFILGYSAGVVDKSESDFAAILGLYFDSIVPPGDAVKMEKSFLKHGQAVGQFCIPAGVLLSQVGDVFCDYLKSNPASRHLSANVILVAALKQAWPCKPPKQ